VDDPDLAAETRAAVITAARRAGFFDPAAARAALDALGEKASDEASHAAIDSARNYITEHAGCIVRWDIAGPYATESQSPDDVFHHAFAPETGAANAGWRPLLPDDDEHPWVFDLTPLNGTNCCVYLRAAVWSPKRQKARLEIGSDDGVKVWLNGTLVHEVDEPRSHKPLQDQVPVRLQAGWNAILLKVVQIGGGWGASCAVRQHDGTALQDLRLAPHQP
jgi:hypothetical protein